MHATVHSWGQFRAPLHLIIFSCLLPWWLTLPQISCGGPSRAGTGVCLWDTNTLNSDTCPTSQSVGRSHTCHRDITWQHTMWWHTTCHMTSHVMWLHVHHMIVGTCTLLHIVHGMCVNDHIELMALQLHRMATWVNVSGVVTFRNGTFVAIATWATGYMPREKTVYVLHSWHQWINTIWHSNNSRSYSGLLDPLGPHTVDSLCFRLLVCQIWHFDQ